MTRTNRDKNDYIDAMNVFSSCLHVVHIHHVLNTRNGALVALYLRSNKPYGTPM